MYPSTILYIKWYICIYYKYTDKNPFAIARLNLIFLARVCLLIRKENTPTSKAKIRWREDEIKKKKLTKDINIR